MTKNQKENNEVDQSGLPNTDQRESLPGQVQVEPITLQDLIMVANAIDASFKRGAFNASEAKELGTVYEKLVNFVNAHNQPEVQE